MVKTMLGRVAIAGILALSAAGIASAHEVVVPMRCATAYKNGPVVYHPASVLGASCWVATGPGTIVYGVFISR